MDFGQWKSGNTTRVDIGIGKPWEIYYITFFFFFSIHTIGVAILIFQGGRVLDTSQLVLLIYYDIYMYIRQGVRHPDVIRLGVYSSTIGLKDGRGTSRCRHSNNSDLFSKYFVVK